MLVTEYVEMNEIPDLQECILLMERNVCLEEIITPPHKYYSEGNS